MRVLGATGADDQARQYGPGVLPGSSRREPVASLAILRSMLTHEHPTDVYRIAATNRLQQIASTIQAEDAPLRAILVTALIQGIIVQRWLLGPSPLTDADPEAVVGLLRPCVEALMRPRPATRRTR